VSLAAYKVCIVNKKIESSAFSNVPTFQQSDMLIAHLSDPHLSTLTPVDPLTLLNKRILGYLSWRSRRRLAHRIEVLDALSQDLADTQPEQIVVTGDLTHIGLPDEFRQARRWLERLGAPAQVTVVPGNHDAYVAAPWSQTYAQWAPYLASDGAAAIADQVDHQAPFPSLRIRGPIALIGLSSACPSSPLFATGRLGQAQLQRLAALLDQTGQQNLCRVVLVHHPPLSETLNRRRSLIDGAALRAVLAQYGTELVLHGHTHRIVRAQLPTAVGPAHVIGASSASAISQEHGKQAQYNLYTLTRQADGWRLHIAARGYDLASHRFVAADETEVILPRSGSTVAQTAC